MQIKGLRLYKAEKLCSETAINLLFEKTAMPGYGRPKRALCYPLRAVWGTNPRDVDSPTKFLIIIPKRKLRHAVDRVKMRRRVREAYRLNRGLLAGAPAGLNIAFIYVADTLKPYAAVERSVRRLLASAAKNKSLSHSIF